MFYAPALRTRAFVPAARGFDRNFERFLADSFFGASSGMRFEENDTAWTVSLDVPGIAREQLKIEVDGAVLRIATVADAPRQFKAAYELPETIDAETTSAKLENGVLTLTLGKLKPVVTARTIEIR